MKLITTTLPDDHNLILYSDVHLGSSLSTRKGFERLVEVFNQKYKGCKNNYGIDGGDMIEAIAVDDKRFNEDMLNQPLPLEQADQAIKDREPIKKKLVAILNGNHEDKLWKFGNLAEYIANKLGVTYGTYTVKLSVLDKSEKLMYKLYDTHGGKSVSSHANSKSVRLNNMLEKIKRDLEDQASDCVVMVKGHSHKLLVKEPVKWLTMIDDGNDVAQKYTGVIQIGDYLDEDSRWYGNTGSFLRLFGKDMSGYAEKKEYNPVELGFLILVVRDRKIVSLDKYVLDV